MFIWGLSALWPWSDKKESVNCRLLFCLLRTNSRKKDEIQIGAECFLQNPAHVSVHERGTENWEKNHRKRWIAGALALIMCRTTFISAGTFAAAETDGIYQEQTPTQEQREKGKTELIQKIEGYLQNAPVIKTGAVWN